MIFGVYVSWSGRHVSQSRNPQSDTEVRGFCPGESSFALPLLSQQTYSEARTERHTEAANALLDPLIAWGFSTTGRCRCRCRWSEIEIFNSCDVPKQARVFGMAYGFAVSCGPMKSRTIALASCADRELTDDEVAEFERLIIHLHDVTEPPAALSKAQVGAPRRRGQAGISESALMARLTSARSALLARTTTEAMQRARDHRRL